MTITQKEIEEEIAKLAEKLGRGYSFSQQWFEKQKPLLKKTKLNLEIYGLKAQLALVEKLIEWKSLDEEENNEGDSDKPETKKGE